MKKVSFLLPVVFFFMISCQDKQVLADLEAYKSQAEIEKLNKSVVQSYWDGKWNERRPEILDELLTQDVIHHGSGEINGIDEYKQVYGTYLSGSDESQIKVEQLIAEGDRVMSQVRLQASQSGQPGDTPSVDSEVDFRLFTIFRLVDGKIAEEWEIMDELAMMTQLGFELVPSNK